jgi:hypothetical protein
MRRSVENAVRPDPPGLNFAIGLHIFRVANSVALVNRWPPTFVRACPSWKTAPTRTIMGFMMNEIRASAFGTLCVHDLLALNGQRLSLA